MGTGNDVLVSTRARRWPLRTSPESPLSSSPLTPIGSCERGQGRDHEHSRTTPPPRSLATTRSAPAPAFAQAQLATTTAAIALTRDKLDTLSFDYVALNGSYSAVRDFVIENKSSSTITYKLSAAFVGSSAGAQASVFPGLGVVAGAPVARSPGQAERCPPRRSRPCPSPTRSPESDPVPSFQSRASSPRLRSPPARASTRSTFPSWSSRAARRT